MIIFNFFELKNIKFHVNLNFLYCCYHIRLLFHLLLNYSVRLSSKFCVCNVMVVCYFWGDVRLKLGGIFSDYGLCKNYEK